MCCIESQIYSGFDLEPANFGLWFVLLAFLFLFLFLFLLLMLLLLLLCWLWEVWELGLIAGCVWETFKRLSNSVPDGMTALYVWSTSWTNWLQYWFFERVFDEPTTIIPCCARVSPTLIRRGSFKKPIVYPCARTVLKMIIFFSRPWHLND